MVPGRTRLVGAVMLGGVGLVIANADVEGVPFTAPGPGIAHALSVRAKVALSDRRPRDAAVISPLLAPAGLLSWPKLRPILRPARPPGASATAAASVLYVGDPGASVTWAELCQSRLTASRCAPSTSWPWPVRASASASGQRPNPGCSRPETWSIGWLPRIGGSMG